MFFIIWDLFVFGLGVFIGMLFRKEISNRIKSVLSWGKEKIDMVDK